MKLANYEDESVIEKQVEDKFIQIADKDFKNGLGLVFTGLSRLFPPKATINEIQQKS
ncbi:MAG: hypothetical protein LBF97_01915 [Elusimicrobiota bacterium]|jgi:hypothetical protein|nr:hypothetical protein [Elusimicrobiota bacterium]